MFLREPNKIHNHDTKTGASVRYCTNIGQNTQSIIGKNIILKVKLQY